jgi:hypothetical protein
MGNALTLDKDLEKAMTIMMGNALTLDIGFGKSNDKHDGEPFDFGYMIWKRQ